MLSTSLSSLRYLYFLYHSLSSQDYTLIDHVSDSIDAALSLDSNA